MGRYLIALFLALGFAEATAHAAEFSLADHVHEYVPEGDCSVCHVEDSVEFLPALDVCLECHEEEFLETVEFGGTKTHGPLWAFNHRQAAKSGTIQCTVCHGDAQKDCMECHKAGFADEMGEFGNNLANVHRSEFRVSHPIAARTDPQLCASCHEPEFCSDCHEDFRPADLAFQSHRRGFSDLVVSPAGPAHERFGDDTCQNCHPGSVLPSHAWSANHAREARKNLVTCQSCHPDGDECLKCHSARTGLRVNPHPGDWDEFAGRLQRASDGRTCRKCH